MKRSMAVSMAMMGVAALSAACASAGHIAPAGAVAAASSPSSPPPTTTDTAAIAQLGTALANLARDSAADQSALDSLHARSPDSVSALRTNVPLRGEDVRQEAEQLFGAEASAATFDIDVSNYAGNRRVLEYLEFFQLDSRDRFEIWLSRLGRYEGMIRERLRARRLPEDLVYLTLIAAALIAKQPAHYGFTDIQRLPPLVFDEVSIPDATGLDVIARLADTSVAAMLELNPQFVRGITPPGREVTVRVPRGTGAQVAQRYAALPINERVTFVDHYVARGQTLSGIAQRYNVTVTMLQLANPHLRAHALRVGQRIIVPVSGRVVPRGAWSVPPEPRVRIRRVSSRYGPIDSETEHRVAPVETASRIARQHGVGLAALLDANDLTMRSVIRPGEVLRIPSR